MRAVADSLYSVLQAVVTGVWSSFWITIALLGQILTFQPRVALALARSVWAPGLLKLNRIDLEIEGGERIDYSKPHIYVLNHQSMADTCAGFAAIRTDLRFVAKEILRYVPFLGWYMWATGMIFVDRSQSAKAIRSIQRAGERIRAGASIIAFPEGTRSRDRRIHPFKKGIFRVALEAGVPIVPVALEGGADVLPADGFRPRPGVIRVAIGEPIDVTRYSVENRDRLIRDVRSALIDLHLAIGGAGGDKEDAVATHPAGEAADRGVATQS
jgi:1-acyl-sn-glycerol-3-phosphate acyltransferase